MIKVVTDYPVAVDSPDHIHPHGTMRDNHINLEFNRKLYELIPVAKVKLLDIGCAGGGLVKSIIDEGGFAVGIEGSDYSLVNKRAEWVTIPGNLFTADVTRKFTVTDEFNNKIYFNVITAWEFFEHIKEIDIMEVVLNIKSHLYFNGFFIGTIADTEHEIWHQTVKPKSWWLEKFANMGMIEDQNILDHFGNNLVRIGGFPIALRVV